jgi:hypothetical protein
MRWSEGIWLLGFVCFLYAAWKDWQAFRRWQRAADAYEQKLRALLAEEREC